MRALPAGHWCEAADSHARRAEKRPEDWADWDGASSASYDSYQANSGIRAIMTNWSGAAYDSRRDRLIVFGGGHQGYGGNELLAFDLPSLSWRRLTDPTAFPAPDVDAQGDGTPTSRHTYHVLDYIEHADTLFVGPGGSKFSAGGCSANIPWLFDMGAADANGDPGNSGQFWYQASLNGKPEGRCDDTSDYDPVTGRVFYHQQYGGFGIRSYEFATDSWSTHSSEAIATAGTIMVIDPRSAAEGGTRAAYEFGGSSDGSIQVNKYPIPAGGIGSITRIALATTGDKAPEGFDDPGAVWDYRTNRIVAFLGGTTVYSFDPVAAAWQAHPAAPTNLSDPGPVTASGGIFGRFRYSRNLNVYVYVDHVDASVFLYRFDAPGDLNGDGIVDSADIGVMMHAWGTDDPAADLDESGSVDASDLERLLEAL